MGIADRQYERAPDPGAGGHRPLVFGTRGHGPLTANLWLIIINVAVMAVPALLGVYERAVEFGHFSSFYMLKLEVWRLITFQFLHRDLVHLAFNMFGLWVFGPMVEEQLGRRKYLAFYLVCGISGGLSYLVLNTLGYVASKQGFAGIPGLLFNDMRTQLIGASAGVFGVIMAAAYLRPNDQMQLLFPPVLLKLRTLAYAYVAIAAFNLLTGSTNAGGEAAHLGGALAGFFFVRRSHLLMDFFDVFSDSRRAGRDTDAKGGGARAGPAISDEIFDKILDKIREHGMGSLTDQERAMLRRRTAEERQRAGGG